MQRQVPRVVDQLNVKRPNDTDTGGDGWIFELQQPYQTELSLVAMDGSENALFVEVLALRICPEGAGQWGPYLLQEEWTSRIFVMNVSGRRST